MWQGYYEQFGTHHNMVFKNFVASPTPNGDISGNGEDEVGTFTFSGKFSGDAKKVSFKKQYFGKATHAIYYAGNVIISPPTIEGHWGFEPGQQNGGFMITYK